MDRQSTEVNRQHGQPVRHVRYLHYPERVVPKSIFRGKNAEHEQGNTLHDSI